MIFLVNYFILKAEKLLKIHEKRMKKKLRSLLEIRIKNKKINIKCDREKFLTFFSCLPVRKDNLNRR